MKIFKKISIFLLFMFVILTMVSCGENKENSVRNYVTLEINPSVEMVLDDNEKVVTVNGLNDDGKMLIIDEELVGKEISEVVNILIEQARTLGYLVTTEVENAFQNNIKVSVSGSSLEVVEELEKDIKKVVDAIIDKKKLSTAYEQLETKKREYFVSIVKQYNPALTNEEISEMDNDELMKYVELATIEKAELATIELEKHYLSMKYYDFQIKCKEQIAKKLESVSNLTSTVYKGAINLLKTQIDNINKLQYEIFVKEDSKYLKLLNKINEYKDSITILNYKYSKGQTEEAGIEISIVINSNEQRIAELETQIITIMKEFNNNLEAYKKLIQEAINTLEELEKNISNVNYNEIINNVELEINDIKDGFFVYFEEKYSSDIKHAKEQVKNRKDALSASIVR